MSDVFSVALAELSGRRSVDREPVMSDVVMEAIAELTRQNRELAARVSALERDRAEDRERLNAHGMLLTLPTRRDVVRHYEAQLAQIKQEAA